MGRLTVVNAFIADRSIRDIPPKGRTQVICDERQQGIATGNP
ncbi:MAG: hypothetical protein RMX65_002230 [Nostoc sp. DedQUE01]